MQHVFVMEHRQLHV